MATTERPIIAAIPYAFYECGICRCYHPVEFDGDCREDSQRFTAGELDELYGGTGWNEVEQPEQGFQKRREKGQPSRPITREDVKIGQTWYVQQTDTDAGIIHFHGPFVALDAQNKAAHFKTIGHAAKVIDTPNHVKEKVHDAKTCRV
jgi:hypothetical protein